MTTIFKEVLIVSAKQARDLPVGSVARKHIVDFYDCAVKVGDDVWRAAMADDWYDLSSDMVGWTALVSVEVSVKTETQVFDVPNGGNIPGAAPYRRTVYKTGWGREQ